MTWVTRCGLVLLCWHTAIRFYMLYYSRFRDNIVVGTELVVASNDWDNGT